MFSINGFLFSGINCGIKKDKLDLGLISCPEGATFAAVTTKNKFCSPSVTYTRDILKKQNMIKAILTNSGNANALTGFKGYQDIEYLLDSLGKQINTSKEESLSLSTGIIGKYLPVEIINNGIPKLVADLAPDCKLFSEAILTTDTKTKVVNRKITLQGKDVSFLGIAKGSGMMAPNMATMFSFILTDAVIDSKTLRDVIQEATDKSFNAMTVDGDASTNDTLVIMASNKGVKIASSDLPLFQETVNAVAVNLAKEIVKDGEGLTKFVEIEIKNATHHTEAREIFYAIANSPLVKTALFGENPNFGRILCCAGKIESNLVPEKVDLFLGEHLVVKAGAITGLSKDILDKYMKNSELKITLDLNIGKYNFTGWTCDLSYDYVKINAEYN